MMKRRKSHNAGFTLLETLVALVILATGIVSILLLFPIAMERHRISTLRTMTTTIAQSQLGRLRSGDTDITFHQWLRDNRLYTLADNEPASQYVSSWVVSSQPVGEINLGLYRVTIGLRLWNGRTEYYTTYVTDR
ncbi:MAG TPA: prepilin-type N-terminal cleavage/methylation domain-containing protein [Candidatus Hydrogenedentes bacterium]|nr:prepilin-type N-terminal cleavage/methylation domain-containing protein [Candidatus Hydrogenedentota bacterium]